MSTTHSNDSAPEAGTVLYGSSTGRWVIVAAVLGSGISFLDGTVVNVALPAIGRDLNTGIAGLQWTADAYLLTMGALILLGGSLGDLYGRRKIFVLGLGSFALASALCGIAPSIGFLIAARALQGCGGALLVPASLAMISAAFANEDRGRAIGAWSGLAGVASAIGPFLGGYLIDAVSWRLIFFINLPLAATAIVLAQRHVPETRDESARHPDLTGAALAALGLAGLIYALIERALPFGLAGAVLLALFFVVEKRRDEPMMPLNMFSSSQFSGANATTLVVYFALSGAMFFIVLELQRVLGYSALEAGAALAPITFIMLLLSPRAGALAQRIGPRLPMTVGPIVAGVGLTLLAGVHAGSHYTTSMLPGIAVFGLGLSITVAPLTAAVLGAIEPAHAGIGSAINNAVARIAGLLAVALLPLVVGIGVGRVSDAVFTNGFHGAMLICGALCALGGLVAFATIRRAAPDHEAHPARGVGHPACVSNEPARAA